MCCLYKPYYTSHDQKRYYYTCQYPRRPGRTNAIVILSHSRDGAIIWRRSGGRRSKCRNRGAPFLFVLSIGAIGGSRPIDTALVLASGQRVVATRGPLGDGSSAKQFEWIPGRVFKHRFHCCRADEQVCIPGKKPVKSTTTRSMEGGCV